MKRGSRNPRQTWEEDVRDNYRSLPRALAVVGALGLALDPMPAAAQCEVKLGIIGVLSGPAAQWGIALRGAAEYVAAEANQAGGLQVGTQKCRVSTVAIDSKYTAEGAAAAANNMVSQGIKFIIGPIGSPEMTGLKPIANRIGLLVMGNGYAKDAIGPQWPLVFHQGPGPSGWADPIVKVAKAKFGMKKVVLIAPNDQGGTDIASVDAAAYKQNGIEAVEEYYQRGTTNFAPIVTRIMNARPDVVDTASSPPGDAGIIAKQLRQAGFEGPIGRLGGPGTEEIARVAGGVEVLKNFYWYEPVYIDDKVRAIADNYKMLLGADRPENNLFFQWVSATRMVTKAIAKAGTVDDTKKVAEALRSLPVEDENMGKGHWIGQEFFGINQELSFPFGIGLILDGKMQSVVRHDAATGK
jgi:branched-chain amino acid transport system substrate-binding protein